MYPAIHVQESFSQSQIKPRNLSQFHQFPETNTTKKQENGFFTQNQKKTHSKGTTERTKTKDSISRNFYRFLSPQSTGGNRRNPHLGGHIFLEFILDFVHHFFRVLIYTHFFLFLHIKRPFETSTDRQTNENKKQSQLSSQPGSE